MDINYCKEKGCLSSIEKYKSDGTKYQAPVCGWSGEDIDKKKCHIYDNISDEDMKVKINRITFAKGKEFKFNELDSIRQIIADGVGVKPSEVYFNFSKIGV